MRISPPRKQAWPSAISNIVDHAKFYSRSHDAVIRVYDAAGNVIETHEHISRLLNLALSGSTHFDVPPTPKAGLYESR